MCGFGTKFEINKDLVVPGVKCDLGATTCWPTRVASGSMVSKVFLSWLRVFDIGFAWEMFLASECD